MTTRNILYDDDWSTITQPIRPREQLLVESYNTDSTDRLASEGYLLVANGDVSSGTYGITHEGIVRHIIGEGIDNSETGSDVLRTFFQEKENSISKDFSLLLHTTSNFVFEDGMDSPLSLYIKEGITRHGKFFVDTLINRDLLTNASTDQICHILATLGDIDDYLSSIARRNLIVSYVRDSSLIIRDSAILALANLEGIKSIPTLTMIAEQETSDVLKRDIERLIEDITECHH